MSSAEHAIEAITCKPRLRRHSFDADAETNAAAWRRGEPVPSTFYKVGKLIIPRRVLSRAVQEVDQFPDGRYGVDVHRTGEINWSTRAEHISPFLQAFLVTCAKRLRTFILQDTHEIAPDSNFFVTATASKYLYLPDEDGWHQDIPHRPLRRKYFVTAYGPTTRFAAGSYSASQFRREMFNGSIPESAVTEAPLRTITLHNEATTVHATPDPTHNGERRITVDCSFNPGRQL